MSGSEPASGTEVVRQDAGSRRGRAPRRAQVLWIGAAALTASVAMGWIASAPHQTARDQARGPKRAVVRVAAPQALFGPTTAAGIAPASPRAPGAAVAAGAAAGTGSMAGADRQAPGTPSATAALFAPHSWHVEPPPPPPPPPVPPPPPSAPPFPYALLGSYAPRGSDPVYILSREDRVIEAHVGDRLDGSYQFESADAAQLVFTYTPLNMRQSIPVPKP